LPTTKWKVSAIQVDVRGVIAKKEKKIGGGSSEPFVTHSL
jgi:hypothetical protein